MSDVVIRCNKYNKNLDLDSLKNALPSIDLEHSEIHSGDHYEFSWYEDGVALSGTSEVIIKTTGASDFPHFVFSVNPASKGKVELIEGVTVSANGTSLASFNNKRTEANATDIHVFHTPTAATGGTVIFSDIFASSNFARAGVSERAQEFILNTNSAYLIRFTSWNASNTVGYLGNYYL